MHLPKAGPRCRASCSLCSVKPHARLLARSFVRSFLNRWQPNVLRGSVASSDPLLDCPPFAFPPSLSPRPSIYPSIHPSIHLSNHPSIRSSILLEAGLPSTNYPARFLTTINPAQFTSASRPIVHPCQIHAFFIFSPSPRSSKSADKGRGERERR